jgi:hypothetical protein
MGGHLNSLGEESVVSASHEGWVEADDNGVNDQFGAQKKQRTTVTYRVVYYWKGEREEAAWCRKFIEAPYALAGHCAHWVALASESVLGHHVNVQRDWLHLLEEPSNDAEPEDLGF